MIPSKSIETCAAAARGRCYESGILEQTGDERCVRAFVAIGEGCEKARQDEPRPLSEKVFGGVVGAHGVKLPVLYLQA